MGAGGQAWQATLLDDGAPAFDPSFPGVERHLLSHGAWVDHLPGWVAGADVLFARLYASMSWGEHDMEMYGQRVRQPRLTAHVGIDELGDGLHVLRAAGEALTRRYGVPFVRVGCNLYRDGRDGVAWHGDRVAREIRTATIAIVSFGHRRALRLRPRGGGDSRRFDLGRGDLLVMGGTCQRTWQHTVPKVAAAGPRISVTYRHDYNGHPAGSRERGGELVDQGRKV